MKCPDDSDFVQLVYVHIDLQRDERIETKSKNIVLRI